MPHKFKKISITPSHEQNDIIENIKNGNHIICDAVAGSGKTTTIICLAKKCPDLKIIQITYNKHLKLEVRKKIIQQSLSNVEVHTYHSMAVKYYDSNAHEDVILRKIVNENVKSKIKLPKYNVVIIDESQDMTLLYFRLISKFINDIKCDIILLVLGDQRQGIYVFKGADYRFLTLASRIWSIPMKKLTLQTSYRVTKPIAWFINEVMLGEQRIKSIKPGYPVTYIRDDVRTSDFSKLLSAIILNYIQKQKYKPEDFFVLAPSIKGTRVPCRLLENELVSNGIDCFVPISDDNQLNENVTNKKVIFSTFHQAKGRERKVVIVYNFDGSYFKYYNKESPSHICPAELYVAVTRASEKLIVIEDSNSGSLDFLKKNHTELKKNKRIKFIGECIINNTKCKNKKLSNEHNTTPTELVKFLKDDVIEILIPIIEELFCVEQKAKSNVYIPSIIKTQNGKSEEVADLNGLIIPAMFEAKQKKGCNSLLTYINEYENNNSYISSKIKKITKPCVEINDYLYLGNVYSAITSGYHHKIEQIDKYDWLTPDMIEQCHQNILPYFDNNTIYEERINFKYNSNKFDNISIIGRIDAYDNNILWEFKCVNELKIEHLLQLIIYAWMWISKKKVPIKFKIMNIRSGEIRILNENWYLIDQVMECLFENKFGKNDLLSDTEFIDRCLEYVNNKALLEAKVKTMIKNGRKEITSIDELKKFPLGSMISYINKKGKFKSGGFLWKINDEYFIYLILQTNQKIRVRIKYVEKIWIGNVFTTKNDVVSLIKYSGTKTTRPVIVNNIAVYYAKDSHDYNRYICTNKYKLMKVWSDVFGDA